MASDEVQESISGNKQKQSELQLLGKPRQTHEHVSGLVEELTSGSVAEVVEYPRAQAFGHTVHSTQYQHPSKRDSKALKIGNKYARADHNLSATDVGDNPKAYVMSSIYVAIHFGGASHLKLPKSSPRRACMSFENQCIHACI